MTTPLATAERSSRPTVAGKFLWADGRKLYLRGVTYGTFRPGRADDYPAGQTIERDFALMAAAGINSVRTFTVPPARVLDAAERHGLRVMVGIPWEQHITFLGETRRERDIQRRVSDAVRACAGHPATLAFSIGNEIPASIVRWYGPRRIERFLHKLYDVAKNENPESLVTYINYPTTEYLELPFLDFVAFNVYLESQPNLAAYLARLHVLASDRPLVLTEVGLDSLRHGDDMQASALDWQIRTAFSGGCAGAFVFGWTDEWHRGGYDIADWRFGLTDEQREPKPALAAVSGAFRDVPFPPTRGWPRVSVIVCSCNGARTIRDCLNALGRLAYPDYEVIVVNDGSTDGTADIAREYGFRLVDGNHHGLSAARNTGLALATGEIVAYIDDDAFPDPDWLSYLTATLVDSSHAGAGGPNIAPPEAGLIASSVANAPGSPSHVLISEREAEHVPGCNLAIYTSALRAIGGFDPQFQIAGDDVDICWRLQQHGWTLGFSPAAMVWHHPRNSVRAFWRQQKSYGRAEALLEKKWPEKYNRMGTIIWTGRLYSADVEPLFGMVNRIYHGVWGLAPFQSAHRSAPGLLYWLAAAPESHLLVVILAALSILGILWRPLLLVSPLLILAVGVLIQHAVAAARRAVFRPLPQTWFAATKLRTVTAFLHVLQPLARLQGRLSGGLSAWRHRRLPAASVPWPRTLAIWSECGKPSESWLEEVERLLRTREAVVRRGGDCDRWDLEITGGTLASVRLLMAVEEHGGNRQFVKFRIWPRCSASVLAVGALLAALSMCALLGGAGAAGMILGAATVMLAARVIREWAGASSAIRDALDPPRVAGAHEREPSAQIAGSAPAEVASGESL